MLVVSFHITFNLIGLEKNRINISYILFKTFSINLTCPGLLFMGAWTLKMTTSLPNINVLSTIIIIGKLLLQPPS